jgi:hypothetical protein
MLNHGKLVFELHDADVGNTVEGTLLGRIGRSGTIAYAYQAEMHLQEEEVLNAAWRRAYLKRGGAVLAVWERDMSTGVVRYVARDAEYDGEWALPFVASPDARIAAGAWGTDAATEGDALVWARVQLETSITAILLDDGEIRFAWELVDGEPELISRGPSALR